MNDHPTVAEVFERAGIILLFVLAALLVLVSAAHAGGASGQVLVSKASPLRVVATGVTADCTWPAGTVVAMLGTTGGDGNAVTYSLGGTPTGDFAVSGATIVVGANGIAPANCGKSESLTINASQP